MTTITGSIQIAKKTKAAWELQNPTLLDGQIIAEIEGGNLRFKVGDGVTAYTLLPYTTIKNTDFVTEGVTNLYFTDNRADARIAAARNVGNGIAGLDGSGLIPSSLLPSYVDDVVEYADLVAFPVSGSIGKIYVALDTNKIYRWSGSTYVEISASPGSTDAVPEGATNLYFTNGRADARIAAAKNINNGIAGLDGSGLIPASLLPSYVDDVLEYANLAAFPVSGSTGKMYVALDTNKIYRWGGSAYIEISASPGSTDAVTEGATNLYFTNTRADARADARITATKNVNNGIAGLDSGGLIPASLLPSYVDDVLEYANLAGFPVSGETGKIYVALATNKVYRWSGSAYVEISASPGSTDAVPEGATNLYFTTARARAAFSNGTGISIASGVISLATSYFPLSGGTVNGYLRLDGYFSNLYTNHGEKYVSLGGSASSFNLDIPTHFPHLVINGNITAITMQLGIFGPAGSVQNVMVGLTRTGGGSWGSYTSALSTGSSLFTGASGSGTGTSGVINITTVSGCYVGAKVSIITQ